MTTEYTPAESVSTTGGSAAPQPSILQKIFMGPREIRPVWRVLIYLVLVAAFVRGFGYVNSHVAPIRDWLGAQPTDVIAAAPQIYGELAYVLIVFLPAVIMSKIENRRFGEYGLPVSEAFGKRFWLGVPFGFAMMSLLIAGIAAFHGYSMDGVSTTGGEALKFGILYGIGFLLVGFFEEFGFRGYLQYTLASGIGFWPSAIALSFLFGFVHLGNPGEGKLGALMAGLFGLLALFTLRRTGSLWFAVGMHAGFDWTETFFYGVADSGLQAQGHLLNSSFHGPLWLTGGSIGPEGSYVVSGVLAISAVAIHYIFPAKQASA